MEHAAVFLVAAGRFAYLLQVTPAARGTTLAAAADMYAPGSAEQFERMRPGSPFGELDLVFDAGLGR